MYMNSTESEKIFGYAANFYFVRGGQIKPNAVGHPINIPTSEDCISFTWEATNLKNKLHVAISIILNVSKMVEIRVPSSLRTIPHKKKDFCITAACTHEKEGVVAIDVHFNITGFGGENITNLQFKRTKYCEKDIRLASKNGRVTNSYSVVLDDSKFVYVGVAIACAVIVILAVTIAVLHVQSIPKSDKNKQRDQPRRPVGPPPRLVAPRVVQNTRPMNLTVPVLRHTYLPPERLGPVGCPATVLPNNEVIVPKPAETSTIGNQIPQDPLHPEDTLPLREKRNKEIREKLQDIVLDRLRVSLGEILQEGTFGKIYEGVVTGPEDGEGQNVFVKTVSEKASDEQASLLLAEGSMLKGLNHQNICSIVYVCLSEEEVDRPFVVTPIMNQGNLKNFLKKSRTPEGTGLEKSVTTRDLIDMALQIANGMLYLEMRSLVHKDLATRNCLIDDEFHIKITDCALSRDLFPMDYHCLGDNENKPVKWMAVESLEQHRFTTASDVWSFGVTLWELITLGQQPYNSIDAFEMVFYLKNGHRLGQPTGCPDDLFTIMGYCWALSGEERPGFAQLLILLTKFFNALIQFI